MRAGKAGGAASDPNAVIGVDQVVTGDLDVAQESFAVNKAPSNGLQKWWWTTAQGTSDQMLTGQAQSVWMSQAPGAERYAAGLFSQNSR